MSTLKDARAAEWQWIAPETLQKVLYQQENHKGQMLTLEELRSKLEQAFNEIAPLKRKGHIKLIASTLTGGLYSELFFIQFLLKAVMVNQSRLSVITYMGTEKEDKINAYEAIEDLRNHEKYRKRVRFCKLETEILKQNMLKAYLDKCFDPGIPMSGNPSSPPLFLLSIADHIFHITPSKNQWKVVTYQSKNKRHTEDGYNELFKSLSKTLKVSPVEKREPASVYMKLWQAILNIISPSRT